jgi:hypothetical protein
VFGLSETIPIKGNEFLGWLEDFYMLKNYGGFM